MTCTDSDTQYIHELQKRLRQAIDIISDRELSLMALTAHITNVEAENERLKALLRQRGCKNP